MRAASNLLKLDWMDLDIFAWINLRTHCKDCASHETRVRTATVLWFEMRLANWDRELQNMSLFRTAVLLYEITEICTCAHVSYKVLAVQYFQETSAIFVKTRLSLRRTVLIQITCAALVQQNSVFPGKRRHCTSVEPLTSAHTIKTSGASMCLAVSYCK